MTPGLAGFVVAAGQPEPGDVIAAVLAALAREFTVLPEPGRARAVARRRTWLDTFDWRLHRAGLTLEYAVARRGGELRLAPVGGGSAGPATAQPVSGWQAARPHLPADLPDGPVTARVAPLVAPRALLPVVTVASATQAYRLLNADAKTVARLDVERPAIPGRDAVALAPRLTVTEIRGYQGQARRAARIVAAVPGIEPASAAALADALRALGRRPGGYSNKVDADITAAMPAPAAAAAILLRLLDTIEANVPGVLADTDTEFLHDLRVSVRRTRSALKLFGDVLTGAPAGAGEPGGPGMPAGSGEPGGAGAGWLTAAELAFFAAEFKWVGDLTTPTRDLDVHLLGYERTAAGLAAAKPDDLEPFRGYLEQRRRGEFRTLARGLRSARFTELTRAWRAGLTVLARPAARPARPAGRGGSAGRGGRAGRGGPAAAGASAGPGRPMRAAPGTAGFLAAERTRRAFAKVARRGAAITADSPAEALHDLRKRCKELRYALEFFAPLRDRDASARVLADLRRLQDCLGEFQDTEIQISEIRALAAAMLAAGEAPAVTLLAMGEVTAGLAARQRAARADFARRFAAFGGVQGRRRMSALLRGEAA